MAEKPLGNLFVRVAADVANFTKGMTAVEQRANKTKTSLRNLGNVGQNLTRIFGALSDPVDVPMTDLTRWDALCQGCLDLDG